MSIQPVLQRGKFAAAPACHDARQRRAVSLWSMLVARGTDRSAPSICANADGSGWSGHDGQPMNALPGIVLRAAPFLLIPLLVLLLLRKDLIQAGGLDAFVYLAYIHDYADLVGRYGRTYYSTRLAHILPNAAAVALFGDHAGYYVVRYILLVTATVSMHAIARRYAAPLAAWLVTIFFSTHVWLLHEIFWDHYDGSVVVLALAGLALLQPRKKEQFAHAAAGFAFAWAANGNPMGLIIAAAYAPAWVLDRRTLPWREVLKSLSAAGIGFALGYIVLIFAMTRLYPDGGWRFDEVTVGMLTYMLTGGGTNWFKSLGIILVDLRNYELLIFPFFLSVAACGLLAGFRGGSTRETKSIGAASFVALTIAFFAVFHFILHWGILSLHFYLIYALPPCLVVTSAFIGQLRLESVRREVLIASAIFLILHYAFWFNIYPLFPVNHETPARLLPYILSMAAMSFVLLAWLAIVAGKKTRALSSAVLFMAALLSSNAFFMQPGYAYLFGDGKDRQFEWDVRDGSLYLQKFVVNHVPTKAPIRFWYGTRDKYLNSVQSMHLWGFSRLSSPALSDPQMPVIDEGVRKRLEAVRYIAILGTLVEIEAAQVALQEADIQTDLVAQGSFKGQSWPGYDVLLVAIRP